MVVVDELPLSKPPSKLGSVLRCLSGIGAVLALRAREMYQ